MTEEFKAARNPANPAAITLPTGILNEDACIIDEQENHIVLTLRVPLDLIRDNRALWMELSKIATEKPRPPAEGDLDDEGRKTPPLF